MHLKDVLTALDCTWKETQSTSVIWKRMYIIDNKGISIGRLTFKNDEVMSVKNYKRAYIREVDETDYVFMRLNRWLRDGVFIDRQTFSSFVPMAEALAEEDLREKMEWREKNNPRKKRPQLIGRSVRTALAEIVFAYNK